MPFTLFIIANSFILVLNSLSSTCQNQGTAVLNSVSFGVLVRSKVYIDKTLVLRHITKLHYRCMLMTMPSGFGKSTTLEMIRYYLSICLAKNGTVQTWKSKLNAFRETQIFLLHRPFFKHFGKSVVISLDLQYYGQVRTHDEVINILRDKIKHCYFEHYYLRMSKRLSEDEKRMFGMWTSVQVIERLSERQVANGMVSIVKLLHKHHRGKRVTVCIDEYDSMIMKALHTTRSSELHDIVGTINGIITALCEMNSEVKHIFVTGTSHIFAVSLLALPVRYFTFLRRNFLTHYLGFNEQEIMYKFQSFNVSQTIMDTAISKYKGYTSEYGKTVYNPWSILHVLDTSQVKNYWIRCNSIENIRRFYYNPQFLQIIQKLLGSQKIPVYFVHHGRIEMVMELKNFMQGLSQTINMNLLLTYLYDLGFLTLYSKLQIKKEVHQVVLPSDEIKEYFLCELINTFKYSNSSYLNAVLDNITTMVTPNTFVAKQIMKYKSEVVSQNQQFKK